jgi:hypothetical protein
MFSFFPIRVLIAAYTLIAKLFNPSTMITPSHVYDLLRFIIGFICFIVLLQIDASIVYHFIKGQAVIKLYVIFNAIEIFDRLCCAFGQDIFDSLILIALSPQNSKQSSPVKLKPITHFMVSLTYVIVHSVLILVRVISLNVAVNSYNNALLTLLVSNNFVEIKSSVFRNYKEENIFQLTCNDILERFQLFIYLCIVTANNLNDLDWAFTPNVIYSCTYVALIVLGSEYLVDWIKHSFILKFNGIRADIYSKFTKILSHDILNSRKEGFLDPSQNVARRIGFISLPLCCLVPLLFLFLYFSLIVLIRFGKLY